MSVLVIGAGIAGLAAAIELVDHGIEVELREADERVGGKLRSSPFAGLAAVDEGADAYLIRTPAAADFAARVGVVELVNPNRIGAAVWHGGLHRLPEGIMLGIPSGWRGIATTKLLSWRGKVRATADLVLPRTNIGDDRLGALTRARLGDEVHERLVDTLVGSIYATDTDRASLHANPQIERLAHSRSLILGARRGRGATSDGPIFAAPANGMEVLARAAEAALTDRGGVVRLNTAVERIERTDRGFDVDGVHFDGVVVATPTATTARLLAPLGEATEALSAIESADIAMVRLTVPTSEWPARLTGLSGYLVPKPDQRLVTAASFGSQKWSHWHPAGHQLLRVSLGRDGLAVLDLDDATLIDRTVSELSTHLGFDLAPTDTSITRWQAAFPQYRPGHAALVDTIEAALPSRLAIAGAGYRGIGVPSCIENGLRAARRLIGTEIGPGHPGSTGTIGTRPEP